MSFSVSFAMCRGRASLAQRHVDQHTKDPAGDFRPPPGGFPLFARCAGVGGGQVRGGASTSFGVPGAGADAFGGGPSSAGGGRCASCGSAGDAPCGGDAASGGGPACGASANSDASSNSTASPVAAD